MSFPRYPAYKDTGVEWLGEVPEHWPTIAIKRVVYLKSGETINSLDIETDGDYPVFGGNGIRGYTSGYTHDGSHVLIGRQGALCGNVNYAKGKFWASEHAVVATPRKPTATRWLGELFRAMNLNQYSISAAQPGLSVEIVSNLRIPFPPTAEQSTIAAFLDRETAKIDALVTEYRTLIDLLKEKRQAVISHAVTKGLDPTVPMKDSGVEWLGEVPEHWEIIRIGAVFAEANDQGSEDRPILTVSIHDGVSDRELDEGDLDRKITRSDDRSKYKSVNAGDLVYNMMRAWQGGFGAVTVDGQVSPAYVVARPLREVCTDFVEQLLRTPQSVAEMRRNSYGVTDFRLRLYWERFKNITIALPPIAEQMAVMEAVLCDTVRFDALISEAEEAISLLQERRTALISAAVTGKIDVRDLVQQEAA